MLSKLSVKLLPVLHHRSALLVDRLYVVDNSTLLMSY